MRINVTEKSVKNVKIIVEIVIFAPFSKTI